MEDKSPSLDQLTEREKEILARLAIGMSDKEIATALFLSSNTIRWYNRQIYSKLGVGNRTQAIAQAKNLGLLGEAETIFPPPRPMYILPAPTTPFIGRSREVAEVKHLLRTSRLLTLNGVGGTGKTRLALHVASDVRDDFADGVYFVNLAPINDPASVANNIAAVLGVVENSREPLRDTLKRALAEREILLMIDNFEHVIAAAPLVSDVLAVSPRLKVVITSREALRLVGEQEYLVPPLSLPSADVISARSVIDSEAGALFVQRVQMMLPRFELSDDNAATVGQICRRLDGLPLAIELAAARCKLLSPQTLLERLDSRLDTLTTGARDAPGRQQTLRMTLEWSYNLLNEDEKTLFARLAVFRGGHSLEAIEAVCQFHLSIEVLDGLASLVDKSLVQQKETMGGEPRFVMLETIHEYAWERLEVSGELDTVRMQHAEYLAALADRAETELHLADQNLWFHMLEAEIDNLRAAMAWSLESSNVTFAVRMMSGTFLYWIVYGRQAESIHWFQQLLARIDEVAPEYRIRLLRNAAPMITFQDREAANRLAQRAVAAARSYGDTRQLGWSLWALSTTLPAGSQADALTEEALVLFREVGDQPGLGLVFNSIGECARLSGDDKRARSAYEQSLAIAERIGDTRRQYYVLYNLAFVAQHEGDHQDAIRLILRSLALCQNLGVPTELAQELLALAGSLGALGKPAQAAHLFGAAYAFLERSGTLIDPSDQPEHDRNIAFVRTQLGEAHYEAAWVKGQALTLDQAVAFALAEST